MLGNLQIEAGGYLQHMPQAESHRYDPLLCFRQ